MRPCSIFAPFSPHVESGAGGASCRLSCTASAPARERVLAALVAVSKSRLFFCAPRELATPLAEPLGLTLRPLPIEAPPIPVALFCSERVAHEPGTAWLREKVAEVVGEALKKPR